MIFRIFHLNAAWKFLKELFPNHSAFRLFDKKMASNSNVGEKSISVISL